MVEVKPITIKANVEQVVNLFDAEVIEEKQAKEMLNQFNKEVLIKALLNTNEDEEDQEEEVEEVEAEYKQEYRDDEDLEDDDEDLEDDDEDLDL